MFGRVLLAGKVIEHAIGFRAERARIAELIPTTTDGGITSTVATRLGVPLGPTIDTTPMADVMKMDDASRHELAQATVERMLRNILAKLDATGRGATPRELVDWLTASCKRPPSP